MAVLPMNVMRQTTEFMQRTLGKLKQGQTVLVTSTSHAETHMPQFASQTASVASGWAWSDPAKHFLDVDKYP